ncbi:MAG TPA: hypothetical protein ENJ30_05715 [Desulfobulbaceae bacterium]|nr:hypothetical protein [Desulfobulbaceae bacterium]
MAAMDEHLCSDEMIMAFVDGELDPETARRVSEAIESDPALQKKAVMFEQTVSMLEGVYDAPMREEVPAHLLKTVREYNPDLDRSKQGILARLQQFFSRQLPQPAPAFALVVVVLLAGGLYLHHGQRSLQPDGSGVHAIVTSPSFARALERSPDGRIVALGALHARVSPVATFIDRHNRFCRRYDMLAPEDDNRIIGRGIACRGQEKEWRTIVYQQVPEQTQKAPSAYEPAASDNPVDRVMNRELSDLLNEQQVRDLIDRGWMGP